MFGYCKIFEELPDVLDATRRAASKYGIYVLVDIDCKPSKDPSQKTADGVRNTSYTIAKLLSNETWVFGYDLCNEPYYWEMGQIYINSTSRLVDVYNYTNHRYTMEEYLDWLNPGYSSTFPNLQMGLVVPDQFKEVVSDVANIYKTWTDWRIDSIRKVDNYSLLTVGYNTIYGLLDINSDLDFVSHHAYPNGPNMTFTINNFRDTMAVPTTMDRLADVWWPQGSNSTKPNFTVRPISYGEFGTSTGDVVGYAPDQKFVDFQTAALYDMMTWLNSLTKGYSGALHWRLNDKPYIMALRQESYTGPDNTPQVRLHSTSQ